MTKYLALVVSAVLVVIDQIIKLWAQTTLVVQHSIAVVPNLFYLTYVRNYGAAFGILRGRTGLLTVLVAVVLIGALYYILTDKITSRFMIWSICLVMAGGAGNLIDRICYGYVVDYLDFSSLFGFPVFNFADCCVVLGTFMILIYILFIDKPKDKTLIKETPQQNENDETTEEA